MRRDCDPFKCHLGWSSFRFKIPLTPSDRTLKLSLGSLVWRRGPMAVKGSERMLWARYRDESGATAVEYAIMAALISVVIVVAVAAVGTNLKESLDCAATAVGALPGIDACAD